MSNNAIYVVDKNHIFKDYLRTQKNAKKIMLNAKKIMLNGRVGSKFYIHTNPK